VGVEEGEEARLELPARDDSVLPPGQRRDRGVRAMRCTFATTVGANVNRIGHAPIVARSM
jgi:hypothetical protein